MGSFRDCGVGEIDNRYRFSCVSLLFIVRPNGRARRDENALLLVAASSGNLLHSKPRSESMTQRNRRNPYNVCANWFDLFLCTRKRVSLPNPLVQTARKCSQQERIITDGCWQMTKMAPVRAGRRSSQHACQDQHKPVPVRRRGLWSSAAQCSVWIERGKFCLERVRPSCSITAALCVCCMLSG